MVRAQVYDVTGQTWIHEVWVYIENWGNPNSYIITINNFRSLLGSIKLGMVIDDTLDIDISPNGYADSVKFEAKRIITRGESVIWDDDFSDGCSASFDIPTGFYKITTYVYKEGEEIASNLVSRVFFINR
jgi:hypothetical protein